MIDPINALMEILREIVSYLEIILFFQMMAVGWLFYISLMAYSIYRKLDKRF